MSGEQPAGQPQPERAADSADQLEAQRREAVGVARLALALACFRWLAARRGNA